MAARAAFPESGLSQRAAFLWLCVTSWETLVTDPSRPWWPSDLVGVRCLLSPLPQLQSYLCHGEAPEGLTCAER